MLIKGDCLDELRRMDDESEDMIYLDPPFYTQKTQKLRNADGRAYEFSDVWESRKDYLDYMSQRLLEMKRVLKKTGDLFFHCDASCSHYIRVLLDTIFGEKNFRSEIIWSYKRWSNSKKGLLPAHQTIFFYSKTKDYSFNVLYGSYSATTNIDQILQERERGKNGKAVYKRDEEGRIISAREKKGVPLSDVWEIPFLNPKARERTGYPTQKPVELLERIIEISTKPGDLVLDPFCGSGTTLVSAALLHRNYIGIDISSDALEICKSRLESPSKTTSTVLRIGEDAYKTKSDSEKNILRQLDCIIVQRNKGIDGFLRKYYFNKPVAVKIQKSSESFPEAVNLLHRAALSKNCSYTILITSERDWESSAVPIPENMIVINNYASAFERSLSHLKTAVDYKISH